MRSQVLRVLSTSVDGRRLDIHRPALLAKRDANGRQTWELTGWLDTPRADVHSWLVTDRDVEVVIETSGPRLSGPAKLSLMAFADASGTRTMVRIWSTASPGARTP